MYKFSFLFSLSRAVQLQIERINLATSTVSRCRIGKKIYRATRNGNSYRRYAKRLSLTLDRCTNEKRDVYLNNAPREVFQFCIYYGREFAAACKENEIATGAATDKLSGGRNARHSAVRYFYLLPWHIALYPNLYSFLLLFVVAKYRGIYISFCLTLTDLIDAAFMFGTQILLIR